MFLIRIIKITLLLLIPLPIKHIETMEKPQQVLMFLIRIIKITLLMLIPLPIKHIETMEHLQVVDMEWWTNREIRLNHQQVWTKL